MLPPIRVASPCTADWEKMLGDARVRYCDQCQLNVYNFAEMSSAEIEQLLLNRTGRICGRLYQRPDGTILTKDCPIGFRARVRQASRIAGAALAAIISAIPLTAQNTPATDGLVPTCQAATGLHVTVVDETGAVVPRSSLHLQQENGPRVDAFTGPEGDYVFAGLDPGDYVLTVQAPGFKYVQKSLLVQKNGVEPLEIKLTMEVAPTMGVVVLVENIEPAAEIPMPNIVLPDLIPYVLPPKQGSFFSRRFRKLHL